MASLVVFNAETLFRTGEEVAPDTLLRIAWKEARYQALLAKKPVTLRFVPENSTFEIADPAGPVLVQIPSGYDPTSDPLLCSFFALLPEQGLSTGYTRPSGEETVALPQVLIHPAPVGPHLLVQMEFRGATSFYRFDPFSNLPLPLPSNL